MEGDEWQFTPGRGTKEHEQRCREIKKHGMILDNYMLDWIIVILRKLLMIRRESQAEARV